ncbi:hypothetical protein [Nocardia xishanensis]|uniref:hypothetical protein n=1 Tax=Nocardia xishanensis TaxID=238964 RepID=UPI000B2AB5D1|nr:hypothetical protein [Nocardia xishanensis]
MKTLADLYRLHVGDEVVLKLHDGCPGYTGADHLAAGDGMPIQHEWGSAEEAEFVCFERINACALSIWREGRCIDWMWLNNGDSLPVRCRPGGTLKVRVSQRGRWA